MLYNVYSIYNGIYHPSIARKCISEFYSDIQSEHGELMYVLKLFILRHTKRLQGANVYLKLFSRDLDCSIVKSTYLGRVRYRYRYFTDVEIAVGFGFQGDVVTVILTVFQNRDRLGQ